MESTDRNSPQLDFKFKFLEMPWNIHEDDNNKEEKRMSDSNLASSNSGISTGFSKLSSESSFSVDYSQITLHEDKDIDEKVLVPDINNGDINSLERSTADMLGIPMTQNNQEKEKENTETFQEIMPSPSPSKDGYYQNNLCNNSCLKESPLQKCTVCQNCVENLNYVLDSCPSKHCLFCSNECLQSFNRSGNTTCPICRTDLSISNVSNEKEKSLTDSSKIQNTNSPELSIHAEETMKKEDMRRRITKNDLARQEKEFALLRGFDFNVMCVGTSGTGKTSFFDSLALIKDNEKKNDEDKEESEEKEKEKENLKENEKNNSKHTVTIDERIIEIEEGLRLKLIDTPGFGDAIDNSRGWCSIRKYVKGKFKSSFCEELKVDRNVNRRDERIHCCLYFIEASGHRLKEMDIQFMKRLQNYVNLVPIIGRADSLEIDDLNSFKKAIREDLEKHKIDFYKFPKSKGVNYETPFAVMTSNKRVQKSDKSFVYGRKWNWGIAEAENEKHSDFPLLRTLLIRRFMKNLQNRTNEHYEKYRRKRMQREALKKERETVLIGSLRRKLILVFVFFLLFYLLRVLLKMIFSPSQDPCI